MRSEHAASEERSRAAALADLLPPLPRPWNIDRVVDELAARRGQTITVHAVQNAAFPTGLWYFDGAQDHILIRASARGTYRDHIILHEICHMLAGHGARSATADVSALADHNERPSSDEEELLAERFAAVVLRRARRAPASAAVLEQSVADIFGAPDA